MPALETPQLPYLNSKPLTSKAATSMPEPELTHWIETRVLFLRQCKGCMHYDAESMIVGWLLGQGIQPRAAVELATRWALHYENID